MHIHDYRRRVRRRRFRERRERGRAAALLCALALALCLAAGAAAIATPPSRGGASVVRWEGAADGDRTDLAVAMAAGTGGSAVRCAGAGPAGAPRAGGTGGGGTDAARGGGCRAAMRWPVRDPDVVAVFEPPPEPRLAGHRGVDLAAAPGDPLHAPADGVIAFNGTVAGKSVVTIGHGSLTSTFEPARSGFAVGARVRRGEAFAEVGGGSDHCARGCVHWGLRRGRDRYLDPQSRASPTALALKPVATQPVTAS